MDKKLSRYIRENLDDIIATWRESMKYNETERFFQVMSDDVIERTSREFAEMMVSNLEEDAETVEARITDFSQKVVRFGWSLSYVISAIDRFSHTVSRKLQADGLLLNEEAGQYSDVLDRWLTPMRTGIVDSFSRQWEATVQLQKIALQELSASLIPVFDRISVMPLVGTVDTERAKQIIENLLTGVVRHRCEVVLLDITGVPVVDTMVAHHMIQAADAVRLVGAKCMLVGIRPEIAQTIVALGIDLKEFTTTSTLQRGVEQALAWTNRKIVEVEQL